MHYIVISVESCQNRKKYIQALITIRVVLIKRKGDRA
mgnify:FL=1|jgi:hypothetical protein